MPWLLPIDWLAMSQTMSVIYIISIYIYNIYIYICFFVYLYIYISKYKKCIYTLVSNDLCIWMSFKRTWFLDTKIVFLVRGAYFWKDRTFVPIWFATSISTINHIYLRSIRFIQIPNHHLRPSLTRRRNRRRSLFPTLGANVVASMPGASECRSRCGSERVMTTLYKLYQ